MPLLELKKITKDFSGVQALDGVSFDLEKGEIHALCGENGAGKSTLIKILCGYYPFGSYGGEILLDGRPARFESLRASEEKGIALIAQELALVSELSVAENISLGREPVRNGFIRRREVEARAVEALKWVGLELDPSRPIHELGIGQQQLVEIAKALSKKASILVLDEPTAALGESDAKRLLELLRQLRSQGVSCVYISHRLEEIRGIADRVTVLRDGKSVVTAPLSQLTQEALITHMVGREVKNLYPRPPEPKGAVLFSARNLNVEDPANPGRFVVHDLSLEVRAGEILGVGGLMGAGRTALLSALFGAARSSASGSLEIQGVKRGLFSSPREAVSQGVVLVSEDRKRYGLVPEASVQENLLLAVLEKISNRGFLSARACEKIAEKRVEDLRIKIPGLSAWMSHLSGGNQQKVVLGKWLEASPRVLLLDEPTRGIDVGAKAEIYALLGRLSSQGLAMILVSSDLPEFLGLCHRVLILNQGEKTGEFHSSEATPEKILAAAVLGNDMNPIQSRKK